MTAPLRLGPLYLAPRQSGAKGRLLFKNLGGAVYGKELDRHISAAFEAQAHLVADGFEDISRLVRLDLRIRT